MSEVATKLRNKIAEAEAHGQIIDVTKLTERGTGLHKIKPPTEKSSRIRVDDLPIASASYESYVYALELLGIQDTYYSDKFNTIQSARQSAPPRTSKAAVSPRKKSETSNATKTTKLPPIPSSPRKRPSTKLSPSTQTLTSTKVVKLPPIPSDDDIPYGESS